MPAAAVPDLEEEEAPLVTAAPDLPVLEPEAEAEPEAAEVDAEPPLGVEKLLPAEMKTGKVETPLLIVEKV